MRSMKRLWLRIKTVGWAVLQDLFGEGDLPGQAPGPGIRPILDAGGAVEVLSTRLQELQPVLAGLMASQRRVEQEQQRAVETLAALDGDIDQAIRLGQDEPAHALLTQRTALEARAAEIAARCQTLSEASQQARTDVVRLRERIDAARWQASAVADRAGSAGAIEEMQRVRREIERDLGHLQESLTEQAEQTARRSDRAAAWRDLER